MNDKHMWIVIFLIAAVVVGLWATLQFTDYFTTPDTAPKK